MKHTTSTRFAPAGILAFLFTFLLSANSFAAVDAYLTLEGTKGEGIYQAKIDPATGNCMIKNIPQGTYTATLTGSPEYFNSHSSDGGTIEISSFSWGTSNSSSIGTGTGASTGKVNVSTFSIMKKTDMASPKAAIQPSSGGFTHKSCVLFVRKAGGDPKSMQVTLQTVTISGGGEELPKESLERSSSPKTGYDVKANVKI